MRNDRNDSGRSAKTPTKWKFFGFEWLVGQVYETQALDCPQNYLGLFLDIFLSFSHKIPSWYIRNLN